MRFRRRRRLEVAINIAPLVDVVFLLVIFFAVTTTFLDTAGLRLDLPRSSSKTTREPSEVAVHLTAEGRLSIGGEDVAEDQLADRLRAIFEDSGAHLVVLRADERARHGDVVRVMDRIRESGARSLTVAAKPGP